VRIRPILFLDELLSYYGFAIENNDFDFLTLAYNPDKPKLLTRLEQQPLAEKVNVLPYFKTHFQLSLRTDLEMDILRYLRGPFLPVLLWVNISVPIFVSAPISNKIERQILDFLINNLKQAEDTYPTTLEEDEQLLSMKDIPPKLYSALIYRIARKRILKHMLWNVREALRSLDSNSDASRNPHMVTNDDAPCPTDLHSSNYRCVHTQVL
jgi:hypothetical protein